MNKKHKNKKLKLSKQEIKSLKQAERDLKNNKVRAI